MPAFWDPLINLLVNLITWGVIIHVMLSWFLDPYHPAREFTARVFEPLLRPIRQIMPDTGMFDFSPIILILLVQLIGYFLTSLI